MTYLERWDVYHLIVLVPGDNGDDGRPAGTHVVPAVQYLTRPHIHVGVRLQPPGQPAAAGATRTGHKVTQEQSLIGVTATRELSCVYLIVVLGVRAGHMLPCLCLPNIGKLLWYLARCNVRDLSKIYVALVPSPSKS